eukprot:m.124959 g.124959  ORF g.124959 m.124959 type:complete len:232 (-) comp13520_c0_seq2:514-1209(-)
MRTEQVPTGLAFRDMTIEVKEAESNAIETTGSKLIKLATAIPNALKSKRPSEYKRIVEGVSGTVCPGETLLIIGAAGSGCSSLMKVLAGRYNPKEVVVSGDLSYSDINCSQDNKVFLPPTEIAARIGFCYEGDNHIPELTVKQTLDFIGSLFLPQRAGKKGSAEQEIYKVAKRQGQRDLTPQVLRDLGILHVADTPVGDDLIRGVSGGQKKRVTFAEVMIKFPALAFFDGY